MTKLRTELHKECRLCGDLTAESELKTNGGICDDCDDERANDDESWGEHELC